MFDHYKWKSWEGDAKVYVGSDEKLPLEIGCCLYYLDRSEPGGTVNWAAGATNGIVDDAGVPLLSWTSYDNGMKLILPYEEEMYFTSEGIVVIPICAGDEEITSVTTEIATEGQTLPLLGMKPYPLKPFPSNGRRPSATPPSLRTRRQS